MSLAQEISLSFTCVGMSALSLVRSAWARARVTGCARSGARRADWWRRATRGCAVAAREVSMVTARVTPRQSVFARAASTA